MKKKYFINATYLTAVLFGINRVLTVQQIVFHYAFDDIIIPI